MLIINHDDENFTKTGLAVKKNCVSILKIRVNIIVRPINYIFIYDILYFCFSMNIYVATAYLYTFLNPWKQQHVNE